MEWTPHQCFWQWISESPAGLQFPRHYWSGRGRVVWIVLATEKKAENSTDETIFEATIALVGYQTQICEHRHSVHPFQLADPPGNCWALLTWLLLALVDATTHAASLRYYWFSFQRISYPNCHDNSSHQILPIPPILFYLAKSENLWEILESNQVHTLVQQRRGASTILGHLFERAASILVVVEY